MKEELKENIINFLQEWANCDNRATRFPYYWTIADERYQYVQDENGEYASHDCDIVKVTDVLQWAIDDGNLILKEYGFDTLEQVTENIGYYEPSFVDEILEQYDCVRLAKVEETYYEGVFFTEKDAEEYLESTRNHHFGPNPRTYVESTCCWGRDSRTNQFLINLFDYFGIENKYIERN